MQRRLEFHKRKQKKGSRMISVQQKSCLVILMVGATLLCAGSAEPATKRAFTVADEIGLTLFGSASGGDPQIHFSPDGNYFAVWSERGRLDLNRVEDSLRFYRTEDVEKFLQRSDGLHPPEPVWVLNRSTSKKGPVINEWRWLADSSGVAFLERTDEAGGKMQLVLGDLRNKSIQALTTTPEDIKAFDVRDRSHYVYTAADPAEAKKLEAKKEAERRAPAIVGTGVNLDQLLFPDDPAIVKAFSSLPACLWVVVGGKHFQVKHNGAAVVPRGNVALSPDGRSVVTTLQVREIPASWNEFFPPPSASTPSGLRAGKSADQFVRIDLTTGTVDSLTDAPMSDAAGWWWSEHTPEWSNDGKALLLPGTFVKSKENASSRPCVATVDVRSKNAECIEILKSRFEEVSGGKTEVHREEGYHYILGAHFAGAGDQQVLVDFIKPDESRGTTKYQRGAGGKWEVAQQIQGEPRVEHNGIEVAVKEAFDKPPLLVASRKDATREIWNANPQLEGIELGDASVYSWKDKEGREWKGGLYKPVGYKEGQPYPLVIQTHGFDEKQFRPSGVFPTAFAARALAGAGIMVLQIVNGAYDCTGTSEEGPCGLSMLESAAKQLVSQGLADPEKIGAIGFSRTCFQVMEELTAGSLKLKAASLTDGVMFSYAQFILVPERFGQGFSTAMGAPPHGEGLQQWLKNSPGFNLDRITTPLLVNAEGTNNVMFMWEPYAVLHYLHKPVELVMLNTDEHVLTNPAVRLASQGGSVDWFRFWLQGYEDPDAAKLEQYKRWRGLRELQAANEKELGARETAAH